MCLKCEQLLDINKENKEKNFFSFNYDRVFKSIICDEKVRKAWMSSCNIMKYISKKNI